MIDWIHIFWYSNGVYGRERFNRLRCLVAVYTYEHANVRNVFAYCVSECKQFQRIVSLELLSFVKNFKCVKIYTYVYFDLLGKEILLITLACLLEAHVLNSQNYTQQIQLLCSYQAVIHIKCAIKISDFLYRQW